MVEVLNMQSRWMTNKLRSKALSLCYDASPSSSKSLKGVLCNGAVERYAMTGQLRQEQVFLVVPMFSVLGVSKSGNYAWQNRKLSDRRLENEQ